MIYLCKDGNFYDDQLVGTKVPKGSVSVNQEKYLELLVGREKGMLAAILPDGSAGLVERPPLSSDELQEGKNRAARAYLTKTDWYVIRQHETGEKIPTDISENRKKARSDVIEHG